jgi:hypothetical protein
MPIREEKEEIFNSWNEFFKWHSIKSQEDNFRDVGLSDDNGKIKSKYIELY